MDDKLKQIREQFFSDANAVTTPEALTALRDKYLGRKSGKGFFDYNK